jgi:hypothetical protein
MYQGQVIRSGGADLAEEIEKRGYDWIIGDLPQEEGSSAGQQRELSPGERAFAEQHQAESARESA